MTIEHERATLLLTDLVAGRLAGPVRSEVSAHVDRCESCRRAVRTIEVLADGMGGAMESKGHLSSEQVVAYALGEICHTDPGSEAVVLKAHLEHCASCADEVETVRRAEKAATTAHQTSAPDIRPAPRSHRPSPWTLLAAAAALVFAALSYPVWMGLIRTPPMEEQFAGVIEPVWLTASARGPDVPERAIALPKNEPWIVFLIQPLLPSEHAPEATARFSIKQDGKEVWHDQLELGEASRRLREQGAILLAVPSDALRPGAAEVDVSFAGAEGFDVAPIPFTILRDTPAIDASPP